MQSTQKSTTAPAFWSLPENVLFDQLKSSANGLKEKEATSRLSFYGLNTVKPKHSESSLSIFLNQFKSPITILLVVSALLSFFLRDHVDAIIILIIIGAGSILSFWQEKGANDAVKKLMSLVQIKSKVKRDGVEKEIPIEKIVPGDCVMLQAGDTVPGDARILISNVLFIDEAAFTGETYPVEKTPGVIDADVPLTKRTNTLFMGSHVISGSALIMIVNTGHSTEFGAISKKLSENIPATEFERGVKKFGYLLTEVTLILVIIIFAINVLLHKPVLDSLLFSLAIAVGLTPQLLPAIISVNLSRGAKRMAEKHVVVKRLASIENFGSMDILCSDKTGTLTEGKVALDGTWDYMGQPSAKALEFSIINASLQLGFHNPIDDAICEKLVSKNAKKFIRLGEVPYDFIRKKLTILAKSESQKIIISKGALKNVLENCSHAEATTGEIVSIALVKENIFEKYKQYSAQGLRTLGVAYKNTTTETVSASDEADMIFAGFITLFDPPKKEVNEVVNALKKMGVTLKVITGDNALVAIHLAKQIGVENPIIVTGAELRLTSDAALMEKVVKTHIFAEVEPNQKEKIILALQKRGHVVGFIGDGINDASALHRADVGISVDTAVDVAKGAADIILLDKDLDVLINGVREGRRTFANTLKYVFMATSANFGNMFSVAGASLFLPFLPLLPKQILLANILTDLPELAIASDRVDMEAIEKPRRWNITFIRKFMLIFGALSSVFDYLTFGVLLWAFDAGAKEFQTAWFVESVISAALIVLIVRTQGAFYKSKPGKYLSVATTAVVMVVLYLPFSPVAGMLGFTPLPILLLLPIGGIILMYVISAELIKKWFYKFNKT